MHAFARLRPAVALLPALAAASSVGLSPAGSARAEASEASTAPDAAGSALAILRAQGPLMIRIAAGNFVMGSSPTEVEIALLLARREPLGQRYSEHDFADELPRRLVHLPSFWIDRTEVSVAEYTRCVEAGHCTPPAFERGGRRFARPELPVSFVSWDDARDYCRFRGARLPTEAEFERAARGARGRAFPWGELYHSRASNHGRLALLPNDASDGYAELAPVGAIPDGRTPDGILDLAGNVAEWVDNVYRERYLDPSTQDTRRVLRGGGFTSGAAWLRGASREGVPPDSRRADIGLRCASSSGEDGAP